MNFGDAGPAPGGRIRQGGMIMNGGSGPAHWFATYFGVLGDPHSYRNLLYLVLGLPLGVAYFTVLVTLISLAGGMAVTIVGLPLAVLTMYGWCELARVERLQANALAGTHVPPLAFLETGNALGWQRIKQRLRNGLTWRSLAFLFLRFPHGLATFVVAVTAVSVPLYGLAMPAIAQWGGEDGLSNWGVWHVDTFWEGAVFVLPGILLLPAALYLTNRLTRASAWLTERFLGSEGAPPATLDRVAVAAFTWHGVTTAPARTPGAARRQSIQLRVFVAHAAFFVVLSLLLLFINGRVSGGHWWAVYPIWGLAIPLAMHAGYLLRGFFGLHVGLYAVVNLGLFVIDLGGTGGTWFFYPLAGWGLLLALHWFLTRRADAGQSPVAAFEEVEPAGVAASERDPGRELARATPSPTPASPISVDIVMRAVRVEGQTVELTPKEFDLLVLLVQNPGRPFSRDELLDRIWKNEYEVTDRTVDTHVQRLRKKLGAHAEAIQTVWGVGYRFQAAD